MKDYKIRINGSNKKRIIIFIVLGSLTIFGLILIFHPYLIIPDVDSITHVAWSEPEYETPKATVTLTFTSKIAFTTNYPIHAKIKIQYFREEENDTNVFVHIVNPPAQAFKYPLDEMPYSGLIKILKSNSVGEGELDLEFTSAGSYGLAILSGSSDYLGNMTVAYAGQNKEVINISPPETRFQTEWIIRGLGIGLIPTSAIIAIFARPKQKNQKNHIIISSIQNFITRWNASVPNSPTPPSTRFNVKEFQRFLVKISNKLFDDISSEEQTKIYDQVADFAKKLNELGNKRFYIDGGKSWRDFFSKGDTLVSVGLKLITELRK